VECLPNKAKVGKVFKQDAKAITTHLSQLSNSQALELNEKLQANRYLPKKLWLNYDIYSIHLYVVFHFNSSFSSKL